MKKLFIDTSALLKLYHFEADSPRILQLISDSVAELHLSELAKVEFHSAVWKKVRTGDLPPEAADELLNSFKADYGKFHWIEVNGVMLEAACQALNAYGPGGRRSLDAIQLACALSVRGTMTEFLTTDALLKSFFVREGLNAV